jgi:hypothetical protein
MKPIRIATALLALLPACRCGSEPEPVGHAVEHAEAAVAPPPVESDLPAERPKRFAVSYGTEPAVEAKENLLIGNAGARQSSVRARRSVAVYFSPSAELVDRVYAELREYACDKVETELRRSEPDAGKVLQITAGAMRKVISDKEAFDTKPEWAGAFEGCARALESAFPAPGSTGYAQFELHFPEEKIPTAMVVEIDLGPDHRGIEWRDDNATAIVYVAKVRPVDVQVRCGGGSTTVTLDLATQRGLELARKTDAKADELAAIVTAIDEAADQKGEVATGPNARLAALDAPRLDLAGEPAPPKPMRNMKRAAKPD